MTEAEWLAGDPLCMWNILGSSMSVRKYRLMLCAWLGGEQFPDARSRAAVVLAERFADGLATDAEREQAQEAAEQAHQRWRAEGDDWNSYLTGAASNVAKVFNMKQLARQWANGLAYIRQQGHSPQRDPVYSARIRDIFGNPFRPVMFLPQWRTSTAVGLAKGMYESRNFDAMPILADALQDAGCDNDDILNHCRDAKGTHVRGCWVVDLVLGKE